MKKWLLALSALALTAMIWLMPTEYDVLAEESVTTVTPGDAITGSGNSSSDVSTKNLATITRVYWDDNFYMCADVNKGEYSGKYSYELELYKNDEFVYTSGIKAYSSELFGYWYGCELGVDDAGTYKFRMRIIDSENYENVGPWSEFSEERVYEVPDKQVGTTIAEWDLTRPGTVVFDSLKAADSYQAWLYEIKDGSEEFVTRKTCNAESTDGKGDVAGEKREIDFSAKISSGKYYVVVQAISYNVDKYANGEIGLKSKVYNAATGEIEESSKLATPTNLRWEGWVAKWDAVEGAVSYKLQAYRDGKHNWELNVGSDCSFDFENTVIDINGSKNTFLGFWGEREYGFSIVAVASDEANNSKKSEVSAAKKFEVSTDGLMTSGKIPTPTYFDWGENYNIDFLAVPESRGYYRYELYKDGEYYKSGGISTSRHYGMLDMRLSNVIDESGTYKFRICCNNSYDKENLIASDWTEFSSERVYVKPDKQLGTTVGKWDPENPGVILYDSVEGAGGYYFQLYRDGKKIYGLYSIEDGFEDEAGVQKSRNFTEKITEAGEYYVTIQAYSGNIDKIFNGEVGPQSDIYDTRQTAEEISNIIADAMASGNAEEALAAIQEQANMKEMSVAMQTDAKVLSQMKDLEAKYMAQTGVTAETKPSEAVKSMMDTTKVSMVGAALNGEAGSKMSLDVSVPEKEVAVDESLYVDSVQIDIKLSNNGSNVKELKVPMTITMPIPNSLVGKDLSRLVLIHYSSIDGSHESIDFRDNGDGTVSFTVTHFSTFVFAMEQDLNNDGTGNGNVDNGGADNGKADEDDEDETENVEVAPVKDNVPKTGDTFPVALLMAAVACLAVVAFSFKKRAK